MSHRAHSLAALFAGIAVAAAGAASAETLIGFTDDAPTSSAQSNLGTLGGRTSTAYESWTQTVAASNVRVEALLGGAFGSLEGDWWITTAVGPGFTPSDVVASGKYVAPPFPPDGFAEFNGDPLALIATGLHLDPGTYFLVLGPASADFATWAGDERANVTPVLAPGFSPGGFGFASTTGASGPGVDFTPVSFQLDFRLSSAAPEPSGWALLIAGFGVAGAALRARSRRTLV